MSELLTTPLHAWHTNNKARMVPFAGWDMPVQYVGILEEHKHTRTRASIFDISHMGEFLLEGDGATDALFQLYASEDFRRQQSQFVVFEIGRASCRERV